MGKIIKTEELVMFLFPVFIFCQLNFAWWWFPALLFLPDVSMVGDLVGRLFAHSSMDRMLGYGLKYEDSFGNTHLGMIGKKSKS